MRIFASSGSPGHSVTVVLLARVAAVVRAQRRSRTELGALECLELWVAAHESFELVEGGESPESGEGVHVGQHFAQGLCLSQFLVGLETVLLGGFDDQTSLRSHQTWSDLAEETDLGD